MALVTAEMVSDRRSDSLGAEDAVGFRAYYSGGKFNRAIILPPSEPTHVWYEFSGWGPDNSITALLAQLSEGNREVEVAPDPSDL